MNLSLGSLSPTITNMIRMDHSHVLMLFRRFKPGVSMLRKKALVNSACLALEIHAQLEEEIFYPALRRVLGSDRMLDKSVPEHQEMRRVIGVLRGLEPDSPQYAQTFRELMRDVLHHVADEESTLLPAAEEKLSDELRTLGAEMTARRMQLLRPHLGEVAVTTAQSFPLATAAVALGLVLLLLPGRSGEDTDDRQRNSGRGRRVGGTVPRATEAGWQSQLGGS